MSDSYVETSEGGVVFAGRDAVNLYRAMTLRHALRLLRVGIKPTRGMSNTRALKLVTPYTGKTYKRTELVPAILDLDVWISAMQSAMPINPRGRS